MAAQPPAKGSPWRETGSLERNQEQRKIFTSRNEKE
jgi:hypothetical protein